MRPWCRGVGIDEQEDRRDGGSETTGTAFAITFAVWTAYLLWSRAAFWFYNRVDTASRAFLYPMLQLFRTLGYSLLVPMNLLGVMLLLSLVLGRWLPYLTYRYLGQHWPGSGRLLLLTIFLTLLVGGLAIDTTAFLSFQCAAALAWLGVRAHKPLRLLLANARFFNGKQVETR